MKEIISTVTEQFRISRDEAASIVAALLDRSRVDLFLKPMIDEQTKQILQLRLKQLEKGVPLEYLVKKVQFRDYLLDIKPGVFIPRVETEYFVELIEKMSDAPQAILEIGTGCGGIAIALAEVFPEAMVLATDISIRAIENAWENINKLGLLNRISLMCADLYDGLSAKFDLIISNPPYIPRSRFWSLPKAVREYEPLQAIDGGADGIRLVKNLIKQGLENLNTDGLIGLEIDESSVAHLEEFLHQNEIHSYIFKKDLFGRFRYLFVGNIRNEKNKNTNQSKKAPSTKNT